jgi:6-phospho-beta-glucosidase
VTRICIVGGGSAYMPGIAYALAAHREALGEASLVLHDIDAEALELQTRLTRSILRSRGAEGIRVEASEDRVRGLEGADLVLTAFRPGGFPARHLDESIAIAHGIVGQETAGPGGFAMALRSIPVLLDIAAEVERVGAPDAVILNYTNPVQIVSEALTGATRVPFIGLCDQTSGEAAFLERLLCAPDGSVEIDTAGANHMTFTSAVRVGGEDATERAWALLDRLDLGSLADEGERRIVRLFRVWRRIPSRYLQYFAFHDEVLAEQRAVGRTRAEEILAELPDVLASYRREADSRDPKPSMARASEGHGDFAVSIMAAMRTGAPSRFILNVPNAGQVPDLPGGAIVETPCSVVGRTARPIPQGPLPPDVVGLVRQVVEHARLTAEAAVAGDRGLAVRALLAHPLVRSLDVAERLVDAYLVAHAEHLPRFHR